MADTVPLEATVELTIRDIYKANVAVALGSRTPLRWLTYFLFQIAWASLLFFALFSSFTGERATWLALLWGPLFFLFFMPFVWFVLPYIAARSLVRSKPDVSKPVRWLFFPDRIETRGPVSETTLQWPAFLKIRETNEQFLLYFQKQFANVLPKRCFRHASNVDAFRKLVRASFTGKTILRD
jgi:hypothetical protein